MFTRRQFGIAAGVTLFAPALLNNSVRAEVRSIKIASVPSGTTVGGFMLPELLKEKYGIDAEVIIFPNIVQRMQALASGDAQIGFGGISGAISLAGRGTPLTVLSNACEGGWVLVGRPGTETIQALAGKKVAVQAGTPLQLALEWKLTQEGVRDQVELLFMNPNDMPTALQRGDLDAAMIAEPFGAFSIINGWANPIWDGYDSPMGKVNLGLMATPDFINANPEATKALLEAHRTITDQLRSDNSAAVKAIVDILNLPKEVAEKSMTNTFFSSNSDSAFQESVKALGNMMLEAKMTEALPDWDKFIMAENKG